MLTTYTPYVVLAAILGGLYLILTGKIKVPVPSVAATPQKVVQDVEALGSDVLFLLAAQKAHQEAQAELIAKLAKASLDVTKGTLTAPFTLPVAQPSPLPPGVPPGTPPPIAPPA